MPSRARRLRQSIARFKRLLNEGVSPELAEIYRAEVAAAEAMLDEIERSRPPNSARLTGH
jgi:hypothetical protein